MVFNNKAQTALEYLLIVVVAIVVVVAVMVFMNATITESLNSSSQNTNEVLCRSIPCLDDTDCDVISHPECGASGGCEGASRVGADWIVGHCEANGGCQGQCAGGALPTCASLGYTGGKVSCTPDCLNYDTSQCYTQRLFDYVYEETTWDGVVNMYAVQRLAADGTILPDAPIGTLTWIMPGDTFDTFCIADCGGAVTSCLGTTVEIMNGGYEGNYTVIDAARMDDGSYERYSGGCPDPKGIFVMLNGDFTDTDRGINWNYRIYGGL